MAGFPRPCPRDSWRRSEAPRSNASMSRAAPAAADTRPRGEGPDFAIAMRISCVSRAADRALPPLEGRPGGVPRRLRRRRDHQGKPDAEFGGPRRRALRDGQTGAVLPALHIETRDIEGLKWTRWTTPIGSCPCSLPSEGRRFWRLYAQDGEPLPRLLDGRWPRHPRRQGHGSRHRRSRRRWTWA